MRFARVALLDACAVMLLGGAPAVAGQYRVVPMAVPGAKFTVPVALGAGKRAARLRCSITRVRPPRRWPV